MTKKPAKPTGGPRPRKIPAFNRDLFGSQEKFTRIGSGEIGGKAGGLLDIKDTLVSKLSPLYTGRITVDIPTLTVITTDIFDLFMKRNALVDRPYSDIPDDRIAYIFQKAEFPPGVIGDLRGLIEKVHRPLAVRSSSLLEDAMFRPFAGVYSTKMIPNNQPDADTRFRRLVEAVKFVYASTFFKKARDYIRVAGKSVADEKMAVIIQEVVGTRRGERYYPVISGVARSYNYYPFGRVCPEDGVVSLALGLGKTIVDGGRCWSYCPKHPHIGPPFGSTADLVRQTQTEFFAVNMGKPPDHDPIKETEYLVVSGLKEADYDGVLDHIASTYQAENDRIVMGTGSPGPRVLNFSPILKLKEIPLNQLILDTLRLCREMVEREVEIEFAVQINSRQNDNVRFGFLQVRPMVVSEGDVTVTEDDLVQRSVLVASNTVMGNGELDNIRDIVYVRPERFDAHDTPKIADEVDTINDRLVRAGKPYLLMGFGRWGSSDPWLGIPVNWSQISGARVIIEATLPDMNVDPSQGSHFFHNITSFHVCYFSVHHAGKYRIDWEWLDRQTSVDEDTGRVRHVELSAPLRVKVDGKNRRGIVLYG